MCQENVRVNKNIVQNMLKRIYLSTAERLPGILQELGKTSRKEYEGKFNESSNNEILDAVRKR